MCHVGPLPIFLHLFEVGAMRQAACGGFFPPSSNQMSEHGVEDHAQDWSSLSYLIINNCIFVAHVMLGKPTGIYSNI